MRRRIGRAAAVALLCASTAGCSITIVSTLPKMTAAPATTVAATVCPTDTNLVSACGRFGDLTTLDPCSVISLGQLPADLAASPMPRDSLDTCDFLIAAGSVKGAVLDVGRLGASDTVAYYGDNSELLQPAGLNLLEGKPYGGDCTDELDFGGDMVGMTIDVSADPKADGQPLCDAATEVGKALATVVGGKTQAQHFTVPRNSIAALAACGLVPEGTAVGSDKLATLPETPSHHYCVWQPDPSVQTTAFGINLEIGPKVDDANANGHTMIDGLDTQTFTSDLGDYVRCDTDVYRAPWGNARSGLVEIASTWAAQPPGQTEAACTMARQLAAVVWPKLPPIA